MTYKQLSKTPIKEIIFSISYNEIVDENCFDKFVKTKLVEDKFRQITPLIGNRITLDVKGVSSDTKAKNVGYHLRNENEIIQLRKGSFSYHYINEYEDFEKILLTLKKFWDIFDNVTKDNLTITSISIRYINVLETDKDNPVSHLVQLYPKRSDDRDVLNFQNSVSFKYKSHEDYLINAVSTQPQKDLVLLDIAVIKNFDRDGYISLDEEFTPMREIKNRVFFDSITAKALLKYI